MGLGGGGEKKRYSLPKSRHARQSKAEVGQQQMPRRAATPRLAPPRIAPSSHLFIFPASPMHMPPLCAAIKTRSCPLSLPSCCQHLDSISTLLAWVSERVSHRRSASCGRHRRTVHPCRLDQLLLQARVTAQRARPGSCESLPPQRLPSLPPLATSKLLFSPPDLISAFSPPPTTLPSPLDSHLTPLVFAAAAILPCCHTGDLDWAIIRIARTQDHTWKPLFFSQQDRPRQSPLPSRLGISNPYCRGDIVYLPLH